MVETRVLALLHYQDARVETRVSASLQYQDAGVFVGPEAFHSSFDDD